MTTEVPRQPLPIPEYFPVQWPDPAMERSFWTWDQMHQPHSLTPLTATFETVAFAEGSTIGFQAIGMPVTFRTFIANGYAYSSMQFAEETPEFPPPWWPNVEQEFMRRLPGLTQTWQQEYLPEVQATNDRLLTFDYAGASMADLLAFIDEAYALRVRAWDIHMQTVMPVMGAASQLSNVYENLLGKPANNEPYLLLQGFDNLTVESGKALWQLGRRALADPAVARLIEDTPVDQLPAALERSAPVFWAEVQAYLDRYGWRSDAFELADPAWAEDPAIPLNALKDYLHAPDGADPARTEEHCRKEREELVRETLERLDATSIR